VLALALFAVKEEHPVTQTRGFLIMFLVIFAAKKKHPNLH
jgi:hypothetical protein